MNIIKTKEFRIKYHIMTNYSSPIHFFLHPNSVPQKQPLKYF